jgi:putative ABC transport system substrate-binding protein
MKRREFITLVGGAAATWPFAGRAQQPAMPVIGFINAASPQPYARMLSAFLKGLSEAGYVENQNVKIDYRWAQGEIDRLPALVTDLVHREVTVIAATGTPAALAAKAATTTIPIVFEIGSDPVHLGLVTSLNRPSGNVTGVAQLAIEVGPKRLELLHEMIPKARIIALLADPTDRAVFENTTRGVQSAARSLGLDLHVLNVSTDRDLDAAFANLVQLRAGGVVISGGQFFNSRSKQLAAAALQHAVPTISPYVDLAGAGGLMSYGTSITDAYRLAGIYTGRVLKGEKPADLPVQQATKVELIINLKTAKALGITVPSSLIGRADEIIE